MTDPKNPLDDDLTPPDQDERDDKGKSGDAEGADPDVSDKPNAGESPLG